MAEYKQYITQVQENGTVLISEDVVAAIVAHALSEVDGVGSLGVKPGISVADFQVKKNWNKSLKVMIAEDNTLAIECMLPALSSSRLPTAWKIAPVSRSPM